MKQIPDLRPIDALVVGGPHFDLTAVLPVEAVGDDTVLSGQAAGGHVGLYGTRHRGEARYERCPVPVANELLEAGHRVDILPTKGGNRK